MQLTTQLLKQLIRETIQDDLEFLRVLRYKSPESITFADFLKLETIYKAAQQSNNVVIMDQINETPTLSNLVGPERKKRFEVALNLLKDLLSDKHETTKGYYSLGDAGRMDLDRWSADLEAAGWPPGFLPRPGDLWPQVASKIKEDSRFKKAAELLIGQRIIYTDPSGSDSHISGPIKSIDYASVDGWPRPVFAIEAERVPREGKRSYAQTAYDPRDLSGRMYWFTLPEEVEGLYPWEGEPYKALISQVSEGSI